MRRIAEGLAGALILIAPFHQGGRDPLGLLLVQTIAIAWTAVTLIDAVGRGGPLPPCGVRRISCGAALAALLLAGIAALRAAYPLAAALGLLDIGLAILLFLAAMTAAPGGQASRLRDLLIASGVLQAILAALRYPHGGPAAAAAAFQNPNHLAAFLNLGALVALVAAVEAMTKGRRRRAAIVAAAAVLQAAMGALLASRGAWVGLAAGGVVWILGRWREWTGRRRLLAGAALALALAGGGLFLARRFGGVEDPYRYTRLRIWRASLGLIADRPLLGFGPGMFRHISPHRTFPLLQEPVRYDRRFHAAHSLPLTLAAENGVPAALLLGVAALVAVALLLERRGAATDGAAAGIGVALVALLAQGLFDDLQERPALVLIPALLAGICLAVRGTPDAGGRPDGMPPPPASGWNRRRAAIGGVIALLALQLIGGGVLLPYLAYRAATRARRLGGAGLALMQRAARLNPWQPEYRQALAMAALQSGSVDAPAYARSAGRLQQARRLDPTDYRYPLLLARLEDRFAARLFDDRSAPGRAAVLYREAARLADPDPRPLLELAGHLDHFGQQEEALGALGRALQLEPNFIGAEVLRCDILLRLGRTEEARRALQQVRQAGERLRGYRPASSYAAEIVADRPLERQRLEQALQPIGRAAASFPPRPAPAPPGTVDGRSGSVRQNVDKAPGEHYIGPS
jgi:O-antigen ligase